MIYFSALLPVLYPTDAETLFTALTAHDVPYALLDGTRDIWLRDFMPEQDPYENRSSDQDRFSDRTAHSGRIPAFRSLSAPA